LRSNRDLSYGQAIKSRLSRLFLIVKFVRVSPIIVGKNLVTVPFGPSPSARDVTTAGA